MGGESHETRDFPGSGAAPQVGRVAVGHRKFETHLPLGEFRVGNGAARQRLAGREFDWKDFGGETGSAYVILEVVFLQQTGCTQSLLVVERQDCTFEDGNRGD